MNTKEHFEHDCCPKCGAPSVPAENVPDQALRGCEACAWTWFEDLNSPPKKIKERLEYLRGELRAERISYDDIAELQSLAAHIAPDDVELLEPAGVPEYASDEYDTKAIEIDKRNGNFSEENLEDYRHENIVRASLVNGQFSQAREQCKSYGLDYEDEKYKFEKENA